MSLFNNLQHPTDNNIIDNPNADALLRWLQNQLIDVCDSDIQRVALDRISLQPEEAQIFNAFDSRSGSDTASHVPVEYELPSQLRTRIESMNAQSDLLESHASKLTSRIKQTKQATKSSTKNIDALRARIASAEKGVKDLQSKLGELALQADQETASGASVVAAALRNRKIIQEDAHIADLERAASVRKDVIRRFSAQTGKIADNRTHVPSISELDADVSRLDKQFQELDKESVVSWELEKIREMLAHHWETGANRAVTDPNEFLTDYMPLSPVDRIQYAWNADQCSLLQTALKILVNAEAIFTEQIVLKLSALHSSLLSQDNEAGEIEALVSALGEELRSAVQSIESTQTDEDVADASNHRLREELKAILKRSTDEGHCTRPPLVLLDECDILNAVAEIISNSDKKTSEDDAWQTPLKQYLHTISGRIEILISIIYAHAQSNASAPFSPSVDLRCLETELRDKEGIFTNTVDRIEKLLEEQRGGREKRKIREFMQKWTAKARNH